MLWLGRILRWGSGLVIGLFVFAYLGAMLGHNVFNLMRDPPDRAERLCVKALTATGTNQRWNMFAPNVGTVSYSPIVVVVFKNGDRLALHSQVEPDLPNWNQPFPIPNDVKGDARLYAWRFHFGDGRLRKFESRAASSLPIWWKVRTNYTRWRANKWLASHPGRRKDVRRFELWRAKIRHAGVGRAMNCESIEVLTIRPYADPDWPVRIDPYYPQYWQ